MSIRIGWRSNGWNFYSHKKINSTVWGLMVEIGVGRGMGKP
jgi:hypothetical protein